MTDKLTCTITLPVEDLNRILFVLSKLPYDQVVTMIDSINQQMKEQISPPPP